MSGEGLKASVPEPDLAYIMFMLENSQWSFYKPISNTKSEAQKLRVMHTVAEH